MKMRYQVALFILGITTRTVYADTSLVVTPETLTTIRATSAAAARGANIEQGTDGALTITNDNNAAADEAIRIIRTKFGVPVCTEWGVSGKMPRFGFSILANQRLVDVLEAMKTQSKGAVEWRLLEGRIVFTIKKSESASTPNPMDRTLDTDITAMTLEDAMRQIEQAYNKTYQDFPLVLDVSCLDLDPKALIAADIETTPLHIKGALPLRQIIGGLLARMANPSITYGESGSTDTKDRLYFSLNFGITGCRDDFATEDEYKSFRARLSAKMARRDQYLDRAQSAGASPAAPAAAAKKE